MPPLTIPDSSEAIEVAQSALQSLPASGQAILLFAAAVGLVLWLVGRRILRMGFVLVASLSLAVGGYFIAPSLGIGADPVIAAGVGGLAGALLGWMVFRITVATTAGMLMALACFLLAVAFTPEARHAATTNTEELLSLSIPDSMAAFIGPPTKPDEDAVVPGPASAVKAFVAQMLDATAPRWNTLPSETRMRLSGAGSLGFLLGLACGLAWPRKAAAAMTGFLGPAIFLPSIGAIVLAPSGPVPLATLPVVFADPLLWAGLWAFLGVIGTGVQWTRTNAKADKDG